MDKQGSESGSAGGQESSGGYPSGQPGQGGQPTMPVGGGYPQGQYPQGQYPPPPAGYGGGYPGGYGGRPAPQGPAPNNNLVMAIISIFCCWPLAIPAIIFATQVEGKWAMGDVAGAQEAANKARTFSMISIGLGVVVTVIYLILFFVAGASFFSLNFNR